MTLKLMNKIWTLNNSVHYIKKYHVQNISHGILGELLNIPECSKMYCIILNCLPLGKVFWILWYQFKSSPWLSKDRSTTKSRQMTVRTYGFLEYRYAKLIPQKFWAEMEICSRLISFPSSTASWLLKNLRMTWSG